MENPKQVTSCELPITTVEKILNYLAEKPFKEVCNLIAELKSSADKSIAEQNQVK